MAQPHFTIIYNTEQIHIRDFGEKTIVQESAIINRQFDPDKNSWVQTWLREDTVEDETSFLNIGLDPVSRTARSLKMGSTYPSAYANYPEEYKFIGLTISVDEKRSLISRTTYSLLEFLGDIGGLFEFLNHFMTAVVKLLTSMKFISMFANKMFEWYEPDSTQPKITPEKTEQKQTPMQIPKCLELLTVCCC